MIFDDITNLKDQIVSNNRIFEDSGYIFWDKYDFQGTGISDKDSNSFYIKPQSFNSKEFNLTPYAGINNVYNTSIQLRIVALFNKDIEITSAAEKLMGQLDSNQNVTITSFSVNKPLIIKEEHDADDQIMKDHNIVSIDFSFEYQYAFGSDCGEIVC